MAYCTNCGNELRSDARYCDKCGASVKEINSKKTDTVDKGNYFTEEERYEPQDYCHDDISLNGKTFTAKHCAFGIIGVALLALPHYIALFLVIFNISVLQSQYFYYALLGIGIILMGISLGAIFKYILHISSSNIIVKWSISLGIIICFLQLGLFIAPTFYNSSNTVLYFTGTLSRISKFFKIIFVCLNFYTALRLIKEYKHISYLRKSALSYLIVYALELIYLFVNDLLGGFYLSSLIHPLLFILFAIVQIIVGITFFKSILSYSRSENEESSFY